jgi:hypothetical protein
MSLLRLGWDCFRVSFPWVGFSALEGINAFLELLDGHLVSEGHGLFLFRGAGYLEQSFHLEAELLGAILEPGDLFCDGHDQISWLVVGN